MQILVPDEWLRFQALLVAQRLGADVLQNVADGEELPVGPLLTLWKLHGTHFSRVLGKFAEARILPSSVSL